MTSPDDESRSDSVWREIVENYGERPALFPREQVQGASDADLETAPEPETESPSELPNAMEDPVPGDLFETLSRAEHFHPPAPPPIPRPRTWQRAVAWGGMTIAPILALIVSLTGTYLPPPSGWLLLIWPIGGFVYLVADMPSTSREPWDDGSRI